MLISSTCFFFIFCQVPPVIGERDDYDQLTEVPVRTQYRGAPDFMDLCEAEVKMDWFMITNSYHQVACHVDSMFTPGTFIPVIPFTPATYAFCFKYLYCKETINLAQVSSMTHIYSYFSFPPERRDIQLIFCLACQNRCLFHQTTQQRIKPDKVM